MDAGTYITARHESEEHTDGYRNNNNNNKRQQQPTTTTGNEKLQSEFENSFKAAGFA